jgi:hypothetical protein
MPVLRLIRSAAKSPTDVHGTANSPRGCNPGIFCQHLQSMCGRVDRSSSAPNGATTLHAAFSLSTSNVALIRNAGQNSTPGHHAGGCHAEPSDTQLFHPIPSALRDPRCKKDPSFPLLLTRGTECLVQVSLRKSSEKSATMLLQRRHSTFQFEGYQPYQKPYCAIGICFVVRQLDTTVQIR